MTTLRAIFFDIDDTLFATSAFAARARRSAVEAMVDAGLEADPDAAYAELLEVVREFSSNYGRHFHQLIRRLGASVRKGVHPALVVASGIRAYHATKEHMHPFPDVITVLDALRRTDLKRGVISNGLTVKQAEKLVRLGLANAFSPNALFISEDLGVAKPHPRIFHGACTAFGVKPSEAIYVGDNPLMDIDPAKEAGLVACLRRGSGKYGEVQSRHEPDYTIANFYQLLEILKERFGVEVRDE
ncbi:MAG: TIGR02253 family HAD-type hydrolase [Planctomycetota bacterium]|jgi:putative hydrolase of the HAD superfamily